MNLKWTGLQAQADSTGLSLIEVVVALAILATGIIGLVQVYSSSLRNTKTADDYSKAVIYARSLLDEEYYMPELTDTQTEYPGGFVAEREIEPIDTGEEDDTEAATVLKLYEITVKVKTPEGKEFQVTGRRTMVEKK